MKLQYSILILAFTILFSGLWIGQALQTERTVEPIEKVEEIEENTHNQDVLTLTEAASYLRMSEDTLKKLIIQEELHLQKYKSFFGTMLPYIKVYDEYIFSRKQLEIWMDDATNERREYSVQGISNNH